MPVNEIELDELIDPTGISFSLNNGKTRAVLSEAGGGLPPIDYLTSSGPLQDGETLRGFRLRPRTYIALVRWQACSRDQYWTYRSNLLNMVRPNRQMLGTLNPLTLRKYFRDGSRRDLYVMIAQGPEFLPRNPNGWDEQGFSETLRFIAHDPTWYDPSTSSVVVVPTTTDNLVFPITFPIVFGTGIINSSTTIAYTGTWPAYPTIYIDGPVGGPTIRNVTTGELIALSSYTVAAGERVTINLAYGQKTIINNVGTNLIGQLSASSNLATWHLEPEPGAAGGLNTLSFADNGATAATAFGVSFQRRFIGL